MDSAVRREFQIFCGKEIKQDDWLWCKRCQRCYKAFEFRRLNVKGRIFLMCHYMDCDGDLPLDSRSWSHVMKQNPELPQEPVKGRIYRDSSSRSREDPSTKG